MKLIDVIFLSSDVLIEKKGRVALNILGILIGCAAITGLISVASGMNNQIRDQLTVIGTNTLFIVPKEVKDVASTLSVTQIMSASRDGINWRDRDVISSTNGVAKICEISQSAGSFTIKGKKYEAKIIGAGDYFLDINKDIALEEGRGLLRGDNAVAIIGRNIAYPKNADEQIINIGDRINLVVRVHGESKEITLRVVGILEEHGTMFGLDIDNVIGIPFRAYDQLFEQGGCCSVVQAYIEDSEKIDEITSLLKKKLDNRYYVVSPNVALDVQKTVTGTIQAFLGGIATISMFVAGIGIVNTMTISVNERVKEIGTIKAIGAKNKDILLLFLIEALYTGLIGGLLGSILGFTIGKIVGGYIGLPIELNILLIVGTILFAILTSLFSGVAPAWTASKMNPVDALRSE